MNRQTYSVDDIKAMLLAQLDTVVHRYAPPAKGSYTQHGRYFTLNPGRADRRVGSFYVHMTGPKAGKWRDHAVPQRGGEGFGDILDLIALALGTDLAGAFREARAFLGLSVVSPELARQRQAAIERSKRLQAEAAAKEKADTERRRRRAVALWLSGQERLRGTPVEFYLRDQRAIDLAALGRQPRALRYMPVCRYYHEDPETGEVTEGEFPAMVAIMNDRRGRMVAIHRTYLAIGPDGRWDKAPVPKAKLTKADYGGSWINISRGLGPRGGKPESLYQAPPGQHLLMTEGIEDALSAMILLPERRIICAASLGNLAQVELPPNVAELTIIADRDENDTARAALDRAIAVHQAAGRKVRIWQNTHGGKDLNDALRAAQEERQAAE